MKSVHLTVSFYENSKITTTTPSRYKRAHQLADYGPNADHRKYLSRLNWVLKNRKYCSTVNNYLKKEKKKLAPIQGLWTSRFTVAIYPNHMHFCKLLNWRQLIEPETGYGARDICSERGEFSEGFILFTFCDLIIKLTKIELKIHGQRHAFILCCVNFKTDVSHLCLWC